MTTPSRELELARLREQLAEALFNAERPDDTYAKWPEDSARQPYCQWAYRTADIIMPLFGAYRAEIERKAAEEMRERAAQICVNGPHRTPPVCLTICHHVDAAAIRSLSLIDAGAAPEGESIHAYRKVVIGRHYDYHQGTDDFEDCQHVRCIEARAVLAKFDADSGRKR